ncbi:MAG: RDD family protein [Cyanobacteria bacterium]|nr:RDD family protein [Cyanobacteriota bacterium]
MEIRALHLLDTAEQTTIEVELAGISSRILAAILDFLIMSLLSVFLAAGIVILMRWSMEVGKTLLMFVGAIFLVYPFLLEWLWQGRTIGKWAFGIRVVRTNGQAIGFWEAFGRNVFRLVDEYFIGFGLFPLLLTKTERRFGDLLCGTLVIQEERLKLDTRIDEEGIDPGLNPDNTIIEELLPFAARMSPHEYFILTQWLSRNRRFLASSHAFLEQRLRRYFQQRLYIREELGQDPAFLSSLWQAYRRFNA